MTAPASAKPATAETVNGPQGNDRLGRLIGSVAKPSTHLSQGDVYQASPIKRARSTKAAVEERRLALHNIDAIDPDRLRSLVTAAIENHLPEHQFAILKTAEESERRIIRQLVGNSINRPRDANEAGPC